MEYKTPKRTLNINFGYLWEFFGDFGDNFINFMKFHKIREIINLQSEAATWTKDFLIKSPFEYPIQK